MNDATRARLARLERLLRPRATAQLRQVDVLAAQAAELAALRAEVAALRTQLVGPTALAPAATGPDPAAPTASAAVVDGRNDRYNEQTYAIIDRVLGAGGNAIDVGAHAGAILGPICAASPHGVHLAVEPLPHLADRLRADYPHVDVRQVALSDRLGTVEFHYVVDSPEFSGIRKRTLPDEEVEIQRITLELARLDDLIPADRPVSFVKIDVEGAELGVLRGGGDLFARDRPVTVFEFGLGAADVYGTTPDDIHHFFADRDMAVSLLEDWLAGRPPLGRDRLAAQFAVCENYYFVAHPG